MSGVAAPLLDGLDQLRHGRAEWVEAPDGARLRAAVFQPAWRPQGSVVLSPGRTEPIEKYGEVIGELCARGLAVLAHDWRGQGLSDGVGRSRRRGHARGWRRFVADHARLLDVFAERLPRPWIGLGHSMGGGLLLLAMAQGETRLAGAVLSAPMLGLRLGGRPATLVGFAAAAMTFAGRAGEPAPPATPRPPDATHEDGEALTHDRERWNRFRMLLERHPELRVGGPTWGWVQFALLVSARLGAPGALERVRAPVTIVGAERDRLVVNAAQRAAAHRLPLGRYVEVAGAFHEILMETDERRSVFWRAFDDLTRTLGA